MTDDLDLATIQREVADWAARNFGPNRQPWRMVAGIAEEVGEYLEATTPAAQADALGDVAIYQANLCAVRGMDLASVYEAAHLTPRDPDGHHVAVHLGRLSRAVLKRDQGIRGFEDDRVFDTALAGGLMGVARWAARCAIDAFPAVRHDHPYRFRDPFAYHTGLIAATWRSVRTRDWLANPATGGAK